MLPTERYRMFSKALVEYKKIGDFQKLTPVLVGIFTEDSLCYPLFRSKFQNLQVCIHIQSLLNFYIAHHIPSYLCVARTGRTLKSNVVEKTDIT